MNRHASRLSAKRLQAWRQRLGFRSQRAAAEALGISLRQYAAYERGEAAIPWPVAGMCTCVAYGLKPME